jgi:hypothetical protein
MRKLSENAKSFDSTLCEACNLAKSHKLPFHKVVDRAKEKLHLVHTDLSGPHTLSIEGHLYYITFTDDYTRFCWVYAIKNKESSTILAIFQEWLKDVENKTGNKVKYWRTDGGTEFKKDGKMLKEYGNNSSFNGALYTSINGVAERLNRSLDEATRAMQFQANVPQRF